MKLTIFILIIALIQVSARGFGQKITLNTNHTPIEKVLQSITNQSGYEILYDLKDLKDQKVSLKLNNVSVEEAIKTVLKDLPFTYQIIKNNIVLKKEEPTFLERLAERWADRDVRGRVVDETGKPLPGASVRVKGKNTVANTNSEGEFVMKGLADDAVLLISYVGYKQLELPLKGTVMPLEIKLNQVTGELEEVAVKGSTGYQVIDKNHPGSFDVIDNELVNRTMGTSVLSRIEDLTPGVLFNKTRGANSTNQLLIRGRNTINSNTYPLIVLDNFPYDGDINNINPNDIESFTILKDASAAAIWGARAGNGVIVITTKRGKTAKPQVSLRSNVMVSEKPDQFYSSRISSSDFIDIERDLFNQGRYNALINATRLPQPLTPVIEILAKQRQGQLTVAEANAHIDKLRNQDVRNDLDRYFYQTAINQDNHLSVSGNTSGINYYLSGGWSKGIPNNLGDAQIDRVNLRTNNTFKVNNKLNIDVGLTYTKNMRNAGNGAATITPGASKSLYPYADLVDDQGNGLILVKDYRSAFTDT
ncbi:TonB-dependent SusC/RagA subfamily outer membrane receptor [Pedobacter sp. AK017]|uniref:SusC/RagA family TonB-linked outer membrane protein n=1 Tax=Pedobacter sp. AK017 TaxID=2723073 RepID=UPI001620A71F|nr:SusC/RagA family TonB-linked outer membrane protein [Pedobacter sp. AK017]MBB5436355.1 TonB-dependent SusC/RagA subfamily outer membrane receptor [Pedobacter sp. AK017]